MLSEFYAVIFLLVFFWFIFPLSLVRLDVGLEVSDYSLQLCLLEGGLFGRRTFWVITEENKTIKFCNSHRTLLEGNTRHLLLFLPTTLIRNTMHHTVSFSSVPTWDLM